MNLDPCINDYIRTCRPEAKQELEWYRRQPTLSAAIEAAGLAVVEGRRHPHQRRLRQITLDKGTASLLRSKAAIGKAKDFHELHSLIDRLLAPIDGIGELYVYDTALRLGASLGMLPARVYLHRGTRLGARALGFEGKDVLEMRELPKPLRRLRAYEVEDFLCIYREYFLGNGSKTSCRSGKRRVCFPFKASGCGQ
jgi:hypothetical protein